MIVVMNDRWFCEMVWNLVEGIGSSGKVVGVQDKMTCKISSVAMVEKHDCKGKSCVCIIKEVNV